MGTASIQLNTFEVLENQHTDKDEPYIWVIGLVIDLNAFLNRSYVVKKNPTYGNIGEHYAKGEKRTIPSNLGRFERSVTPLTGGQLAFGVIVLAFEHDTTSREAQQEAYDIAVDALQAEVEKSIGTGTAPSSSQLSALKSDLEAQIKAVFKADTKWYNWLFLSGADDFIGQDNEIFTLTAGKAEARGFTVRFSLSNGSVDYRIAGELSYSG